jgi:hypothetical protein
VEAAVHPLVVLAMTLPGSVIAVLAVMPGFGRLWDERGRRLLQAMHCWVWPNLIFWSLAADHSPRYSLPLCPGVLGLTALVWVALLRGDSLTRLGWRAGSDCLPGHPVSRIPRLGVGRLFVLGLACWLGVKLTYTHAVLPERHARRVQPRGAAEQLKLAVPTDHTLYLCRLKDEGVMFYYGRPARRLASWSELPSPGEPMYCILEESEWAQWPATRSALPLLWLRTQQREPIVLVQVPK